MSNYDDGEWRESDRGNWWRTYHGEFLCGWRPSPRGEYRDFGRYHVVAFRKRDRWHVWAHDRKTGWASRNGPYNSLDEAKHAIFAEMLAHAKAGADVIDLGQHRAAARREGDGAAKPGASNPASTELNER